MSNGELLKYRGRLAENEIAVADARLRLAHLRDSLREALDPFEPVEQLPASLIVTLASDLADLQAQLDGLLKEQAAIHKVLGR